jgi:hypothetical protein
MSEGEAQPEASQEQSRGGINPEGWLGNKVCDKGARTLCAKRLAEHAALAVLLRGRRVGLLLSLRAF